MAEHIRIISKEEERQHDAEIDKDLGFRFLTNVEIIHKVEEVRQEKERIAIWLRIMLFITIATIYVATYFWNIQPTISIILFMIVGIIFPIPFFLLFMAWGDNIEYLHDHQK